MLMGLLMTACSIGKTTVGLTGRGMFPTVSGKTLQGVHKELPTDLEKEQTILIVAYQRWHQSWVETWFPAIEKEVSKNDKLAYYEVPTISELTPFGRWWIYHGMRSGIESENMRSKVLTLHLDKEVFNKELNVTDEENIYIFLVAKDGRILYRDSGKYSLTKWLELVKNIE